MVRLHANRQTLVVALLLLGSVLASFRAVGDPAIIDNRNGTKTALEYLGVPKRHASRFDLG